MTTPRKREARSTRLGTPDRRRARTGHRRTLPSRTARPGRPAIAQKRTAGRTERVLPVHGPVLGPRVRVSRAQLIASPAVESRVGPVTEAGYRASACLARIPRIARTHKKKPRVAAAGSTFRAKRVRAGRTVRRDMTDTALGASVVIRCAART